MRADNEDLRRQDEFDVVGEIYSAWNMWTGLERALKLDTYITSERIHFTTFMDTIQQSSRALMEQLPAHNDSGVRMRMKHNFIECVGLLQLGIYDMNMLQQHTSSNTATTASTASLS
jgi:hypothetical protein